MVMARPKKNYTVFNMRVDTEVMDRFKAYCEEVGQTRTLAFERIVTDFLDRYDEEKRRFEAFKAKEDNANI